MQEVKGTTGEEVLISDNSSELYLEEYISSLEARNEVLMDEIDKNNEFIEAMKEELEARQVPTTTLN